MADLFNVERTERKATRLGRSAARNSYTEDLQCFEQVKDDAIVNREWFCSGGCPSGIFGPTFEERIAIGIE